MRKTFEKARAAKPCILFFDEFDSLAPRYYSVVSRSGTFEKRAATYEALALFSATKVENIFADRINLSWPPCSN